MSLIILLWMKGSVIGYFLTELHFCSYKRHLPL